MSAAQMVADTLAVTRYLIQRFDRKKIYLMGHSWGSYIGIQAAAKAPELYRAYAGVAQITDQLESEQAAYAYALAYYARGPNDRILGDVGGERDERAALDEGRAQLRATDRSGGRGSVDRQRGALSRSHTVGAPSGGRGAATRRRWPSRPSEPPSSPPRLPGSPAAASGGPTTDLRPARVALSSRTTRATARTITRVVETAARSPVAALVPEMML